MAARSRYIELLKELVQIESVSGHEGRVEEGGIVNRIWESLKEIGVDAKYHDVKSSQNIVCEFGEGERTFVISAHVDTVSPGSGWLTDPLSGSEGIVKYLGDGVVELEVEGKVVRKKIRRQMDEVWRQRVERTREIVYGRGSYDNKGSVVILLLLADAIKNLEIDGKLFLVFTVMEETDAAGIKTFISKYRKEFGEERLAIVLEGSYSFVPVIAHRGVGWVYIKTRGRRCHASTPEFGHNAVEEMCKIVNFLVKHRSDVIAELYKISKDDLLGLPNFSVTSIVGGTEDGGKVNTDNVNVIPDYCLCAIDIRFGRGVSEENLVDVFKKFIEGCELEVRSFFPAAGIDDAMNDPFVKQVLKYSPLKRVDIAPGATEGAFLHNSGFKTLVEYGPGGAFSHDVHEYVEVEDLFRGCNCIVSILKDLKFIQS